MIFRVVITETRFRWNFQVMATFFLRVRYVTTELLLQKCVRFYISKVCERFGYLKFLFYE